MSSAKLRSPVQTRILRAARALLEASGAEAVRLEDVARRAGVSRQAVYLNFGSRAGLLVALVQFVDEIERASAWTRRVYAAPRAADSFDILLRAWARYVPRIRGVARALLRERAGDPAAEAAWRNRMDALHATCRFVADRLAEEDALAPDWTPAEAADWLWALISIQLFEALGERGWTERRYARRLRQLAGAAFLRRPA